MKEPRKYLGYLLKQLEMIDSEKARKEEEIREHINRYDLNKGKKEWPDSERINQIGQNGNNGEHYKGVLNE